MKDNKTLGFGGWLISFLITNFIVDVIYNFFGFVEYNMFSEGFYISRFLMEICIYVICFVPIYYIVKCVRNRLS